MCHSAKLNNEDFEVLKAYKTHKMLKFTAFWYRIICYLLRFKFCAYFCVYKTEINCIAAQHGILQVLYDIRSPIDLVQNSPDSILVPQTKALDEWTTFISPIS